MLLEFRASNYKSFKDEFVFSLTPTAKQKGLDYSVMKTVIDKKEYTGLSSAVIYGPNAAGKTNIIGAMDTFKTIILRGDIRNVSDANEPNTAIRMLEFIPNNKMSVTLPVGFSTTFIEDEFLVEYALSIDIGRFLEHEYRRIILSETLKVNSELVFVRNGDLKFGPFNVIQNFLVNAFAENAAGAFALAKANLNDEELFLMNGFKTMFSSKLVALITDWLEKKFMVSSRTNSAYLIRKISTPREKSIYVEKTLNEAVDCFGIKANALGSVLGRDTDGVTLYSQFRNGSEKNKTIPAELFESHGTIRFVNMFPLMANALANGGTLVIDDADTPIHPMVLMNIVNILHNNDININHAQLVFITHNPIFLNANLFRRDEIMFVERDEKSHLSTLYSLADFDNIGRTSAGQGEDYMKNYLAGRYGAIKDIDFAPIFERIADSGHYM